MYLPFFSYAHASSEHCLQKQTLLQALSTLNNEWNFVALLATDTSTLG
jgi:hypothetical protein